MRLKIFYVTLIAAAISAATANAGPVFLSLVLDPATTANAGGLDGTSTQSGAGRWHLYAFDTTDGSFGISSYSVTMAGINTVLNRMPTTGWDDADPDAGPYQAGFPTLRSANDTTAPVGASSNPITGGQPLPGSGAIGPVNPISGFGREASDFDTKLPQDSFSATTSAAWGDYATDPSSNTPGIFLAEGTYTVGTPPTITASRFQLYRDEVGGPPLIEGDEQVGNPPGPPLGTAPDIVGPNDGQGNFLHPQMNGSAAANPMPIMHQFTELVGTDPVNWGVMLDSYTPNYSGVGPGPLLQASIDNTGKLSWNPVGSPRGDYVFKATASNQFGMDMARLTVQIKGVPEPTTLSLFALAMVGAMGLVRRRNG